MKNILGAQMIYGPSHNRGGVDMMLNGLPVETEGGEVLFSLSDGSKVVLNKEQQQRLKNGESLASIMKSLPKYQGRAENGMKISPDDPPGGKLPAGVTQEMLDLYRQEDFIDDIYVAPDGTYWASLWDAMQNKRPSSIANPFAGNDVLKKVATRKPQILDRPERYGGKTLSRKPDKGEYDPMTGTYWPIQSVDLKEVEIVGKKPVQKTKVPDKLPSMVYEPGTGDLKPSETYKSKTTGWETDMPPKTPNPLSLGPDDSKEGKKTEKDLFDQYNKNLLRAAIAEGINATRQGLGAALDIMKNNKKPGPPKVAPVGYAPVRAILENPQPYINALGMNMASRLRTARESGMLSPELAMLNVEYPAALQNILETVGKTNTQRTLQAAELNARNKLAVDTANADIAQKNILFSLEDEKMRAEAYARSRDVINKAASRTTGLFGEYAQNKLYSDVMREVYGNAGYAQLLGIMNMNRDLTTSPYYYAKDEEPE